ncbi:MAG: cysteine desulfurase [Ignavibacteria bacterium]|nr:cysteine desulfurase [Ignavibacteria bacterium]MCU7503570.1 cysteine desulfurase [Ignavibacteria bacterium]MCU7516776.1 cysteine desulfurase [Ignavibacteria bacterium]
MYQTTVQPNLKTIEAFDVERVRQDFPILQRLINGKPLVYLDNAATSQKPYSVIDTVRDYYSMLNSNVHRGVHYLSEQSTLAYEDARLKIKEFLNAISACEIIYTRGATEAINLVAWTYGRTHIAEGDEVIISAMEHHANIVPWQLLCEEKKAKLKVIPMTDEGELIMEEYDKLLSDRTKFVSIVQISNSLGTVNPIREVIRKAHERNIPVLVDGAQGVSHLKVDVQELDCDFYVFSGHKLFGPTGIGALYGKAELLQDMPPYQTGGDMIRSVTFEKTIFNDIPNKFEAGTPNIAGAIGLGAAIDYMKYLKMDEVAKHEKGLLEYATQRLNEIDGVHIIGTAKNKASLISFVMDNIHPHDIGTILDSEGIAIRTGHHCCQPVMQRFCIPATARASFAFYNTKSEIDKLVYGIQKVIRVFG